MRRLFNLILGCPNVGHDYVNVFMLYYFRSCDADKIKKLTNLFSKI